MPAEAFEVGERASREHDGEKRICEIIERKQLPNGQWSYYVHFEGLNRRLDSWVQAEELSPIEVQAPSEAGRRPTRQDAINSRRATRNMKRKIDEVNASSLDDAHHDEALEKEHEESTKVKNIQMIEIGRFQVDTWYFSPFPEEYAQHTLYICEFTLKYMRKRKAYERHKLTQKARMPPGKMIYLAKAPELHPDCISSGHLQPKQLSVFEVDGSDSKIYCQCLCLLAKLFLDHKTLYYDVDPFLFYVLCEVGDDGGHRIAGYFSKEKFSSESNNIACILVLPQHQRKGYGKLIIDVSYQITIREGKVGSPEKPLSDLGQLSFRSYWTAVLLHTLSEHRGNLSIRDISIMTAIKTEDIISTLQSLNLIKYWKGQHVIAVSPKIVDEHLARNARPSLRCEVDKLRWQPPPDENQPGSAAG
mmetsp:Transcript_7281/g.18102  ORF Transcript_7281/g.18102 Transcript_7281/m.18102 type:complete len:418 (+) Transcript_7281:53-1306(+)